MIRLEDQEMASAGDYTTNCDIMHFTQATHLHHLLSLVWGSYFLHSTYFAPLFVLFLLRPVILNSRHSLKHMGLFFLNKDLGCIMWSIKNPALAKLVTHNCRAITTKKFFHCYQGSETHIRPPSLGIQERGWESPRNLDLKARRI